MALRNVSNVEGWLIKSDIDYFTHFVMAWIPFNAWFRSSYGDGSEREILDEVKAGGNKIRTRFMAKLEGTDPAAEEIRNNIASLHRRLSLDPLEDKKGRPISFENVVIKKNEKNVETRSSGGAMYTVERSSGKMAMKVKTTSKAIEFTHEGPWNPKTLTELADYSALPATRRAGLLDCYNGANPHVVRSLLAAPGDPDPLSMDSYKFVRDKEAIFAGLVEILYGLRNQLFHGELVPDKASNETYQPAYHLLRALLKTIA